jgi:hypothetical protein
MLSAFCPLLSPLCPLPDRHFAVHTSRFCIHDCFVVCYAHPTRVKSVNVTGPSDGGWRQARLGVADDPRRSGARDGLREMHGKLGASASCACFYNMPLQVLPTVMVDTMEAIGMTLAEVCARSASLAGRLKSHPSPPDTGRRCRGAAASLPCLHSRRVRFKSLHNSAPAFHSRRHTSQVRRRQYRWNWSVLPPRQMLIAPPPPSSSRRMLLDAIHLTRHVPGPGERHCRQ